MLFILAATFLVLASWPKTYVLGQDADCDFYQNVGAQESYIINSPDYPRNYSAGRQCRYIGNCPTGYNCRADCSLFMPSSPNCSGDRLLLSRSGDPTLAGAEAYCGTSTVSILSTDVRLAIGFISVSNSTGGRYTCNLTAQRASTTEPTVCRCGEKKQFRIAGGQETRPNEFTMMAALIDESTQSLHCGAVIIAPSYVMTAAHCVYRHSGVMFVTVGAYNNSGNSGVRYNVLQYIIHEKYNPATYENDIALVKVLRNIQFNVNVQPVCLPFKYTYTDLTDYTVTLLGWGTLFFGGPVANNLRKVDVQVQSAQSCNIPPTQLCTFARGKDACQFDSGGPVLLTDPNSGLLTVVGITSNGNGCASPQPGINTNVATLLRWVVNNANTQFCVKR